MDRSFAVNELERLRAVLGKGDFLQRNQNNPILSAIVVTQLEIALGEFRVPSDSAQQFVNRYHAVHHGSGTSRGSSPILRLPPVTRAIRELAFIQVNTNYAASMTRATCASDGQMHHMRPSLLPGVVKAFVSPDSPHNACSAYPQPGNVAPAGQYFCRDTGRVASRSARDKQLTGSSTRRGRHCHSNPDRRREQIPGPIPRWIRGVICARATGWIEALQKSLRPE